MARASAKSPEAFRTISEAADALDLPQHVLRFWETRFSQIKPMKRSGGRRYYRPSDIALLQGIRHLLYDEGYTIKGVQRILREQGVAHVVELAAQVTAQQAPEATMAVAAAPAQPLPAQAVQPQSAPPRPDPVRAAFSHQQTRIEPASHAATQPAAQSGHQPAPRSPDLQPVAANLPVQSAPQPAAPAVPAPPPAGSSGLRFVAEPVAEPEQSASPHTQQPPAPDPASQLSQPSQPMPAPLPPGMAAPHPAQPVNPAPVPPAPAQAYPSQPQGATQSATALSAHQTEALVQALRTLMDCKAQLDNARPAPQAKTPIAQT